MSRKVFNFKAQMAVGDKGEKAFRECYPELVPVKSKEREVDFHLKDGKTVELKTDDYDMAATENFFMEVSSHGKLGGPYRAKQDDVHFFVYYFIKNKTFFWFNTNILCNKLDDIIPSKKYKIKSIKNRGGQNTWCAEGYAIPRSEFDDILIRKDDFSDLTLSEAPAIIN